MRLTSFPFKTLRETPKEASTPSHKLLLRTGLIYQVTSGLFVYTPILQRTLQKITNIVRTEMNAASAAELTLPILQPRSLWEETNRWHRYTDIDGIMFTTTGRRDNELCLAPTAEEVITDYARQVIQSHKDLPVNFYQINTKFRDEIRPRFGLMRTSEFTMKDAYSFDQDETGLNNSYEKMRQTYERIFTRCGLHFRRVEADSGAIGGANSSEFMVLADSGEDLILFCNKCTYAANIEKAQTGEDTPTQKTEPQPLKIIDTPNCPTMEDLTKLTKIPLNQCLKTVLYLADSQPVAVFIRGDLEVNETKLTNTLNAELIRPLTDEEVQKYTGTKRGSVGAHDLNPSLKTLFDQSTEKLINFTTGANENDKHKTNVNWGTDLPRPPKYYDLRTARANDPCPHCAGQLQDSHGIEVGHIFKLGTKYSLSMKATFQDTEGKEKPLVMGCYGIGITRIAQASIEQSHDDKGIIWPKQIAPFSIHLVALNLDNPTTLTVAESLYTTLTEQGFEVLYDNRPHPTPGEKFNDADLLGLPVRLTISSRNVKTNQIEFKTRTSDSSELLDQKTLFDRLNSELKQN